MITISNNNSNQQYLDYWAMSLNNLLVWWLCHHEIVLHTFSENSLCWATPCFLPMRCKNVLLNYGLTHNDRAIPITWYIITVYTLPKYWLKYCSHRRFDMYSMHINVQTTIQWMVDVVTTIIKIVADSITKLDKYSKVKSSFLLLVCMSVRTVKRASYLMATLCACQDLFHHTLHVFAA